MSDSDSSEPLAEDPSQGAPTGNRFVAPPALGDDNASPDKPPENEPGKDPGEPQGDPPTLDKESGNENAPPKDPDRTTDDTIPSAVGGSPDKPGIKTPTGQPVSISDVDNDNDPTSESIADPYSESRVRHDSAARPSVYTVGTEATFTFHMYENIELTHTEWVAVVDGSAERVSIPNIGIFESKASQGKRRCLYIWHPEDLRHNSFYAALEISLPPSLLCILSASPLMNMNHAF